MTSYLSTTENNDLEHSPILHHYSVTDINNNNEKKTSVYHTVNGKRASKTEN